jgi:hypothetical protein
MNAVGMVISSTTVAAITKRTIGRLVDEVEIVGPAARSPRPADRQHSSGDGDAPSMRTSPRQ